MKWLLMLILLAAPVFPQEETMEQLIVKLTSEDFDVREAASSKLAGYPQDYIRKFLDRSHKESDPEVVWRLRSIAKAIFFETVVKDSDDWRILHGTIRAEWAALRTTIVETDPSTNTQRWSSATIGYVVNFVADETEEAIKQWDLIISIDGVDPDYPKIKAGQEYTVVLRRYKDTSKLANGSYDETDKEFEEKTVKVKGLVKDQRFVKADDEWQILENQWKKYHDDYNKEKFPQAPKAEVVTPVEAEENSSQPE